MNNDDLRLVNKRYYEIFGYIPCHANFSCSKKEFFDAMQQAINTETEIMKIVPEYKGYSGNIEV